MFKSFINIITGIDRGYYFRQLFFGSLLGGFLIFIIWNASHANNNVMSDKEIHKFIGTSIFIIINTLLYPYARLVYETIVDFILGNNIFFVDSLFMLLVKFFTMSMCWVFSIVLFPIGLLFIYFYQRKEAKKEDSA